MVEEHCVVDAVSGRESPSAPNVLDIVESILKCLWYRRLQDSATDAKRRCLGLKGWPVVILVTTNERDHEGFIGRRGKAHDSDLTVPGFHVARKRFRRKGLMIELLNIGEGRIENDLTTGPTDFGKLGLSLGLHKVRHNNRPHIPLAQHCGWMERRQDFPPVSVEDSSADSGDILSACHSP